MTIQKRGAKKKRKGNKKWATKDDLGRVWTGDGWSVRYGRLKPGPGRPTGKPRLFKVAAEKLPLECLSAVESEVVELGLGTAGVYVAHDSMGFARYIGRSSVFGRLRARQSAQPRELAYFSFYIVEDRNHEREIETLLIRAASPLLLFNDRKKRASIEPGSVRDYEPMTIYFERQYKRGRAVRSSAQDGPRAA